jgi:hypothetical protein
VSHPRPGDILVLHTPDGLRFQLVKGVPEGDEAEVLAAAIDRVEAWDKSQELGPWVANTRPGIGIRAYPAGTRWGATLRSTGGREPKPTGESAGRSRLLSAAGRLHALDRSQSARAAR